MSIHTDMAIDEQHETPADKSAWQRRKEAELERQGKERASRHEAVLRRLRWAQPAGRPPAEIAARIDGSSPSGVLTTLRELAAEGRVHERDGLWYLGRAPASLDAGEAPSEKDPPLREVILEVASDGWWWCGELASAVEPRTTASRATIAVEIGRLRESGDLQSEARGTRVCRHPAGSQDAGAPAPATPRPDPGPDEQAGALPADVRGHQAPVGGERASSPDSGAPAEHGLGALADEPGQDPARTGSRGAVLHAPAGDAPGPVVDGAEAVPASAAAGAPAGPQEEAPEHPEPPSRRGPDGVTSSRRGRGGGSGGSASSRASREAVDERIGAAAAKLGACPIWRLAEAAGTTTTRIRRAATRLGLCIEKNRRGTFVRPPAPPKAIGDYGKRSRAVREARGWSQMQLAERIFEAGILDVKSPKAIQAGISALERGRDPGERWRSALDAVLLPFEQESAKADGEPPISVPSPSDADPAPEEEPRSRAGLAGGVPGGGLREPVDTTVPTPASCGEGAARWAVPGASLGVNACPPPPDGEGAGVAVSRPPPEAVGSADGISVLVEALRLALGLDDEGWTAAELVAEVHQLNEDNRKLSVLVNRYARALDRCGIPKPPPGEDFGWRLGVLEARLGGDRG